MRKIILILGLIVLIFTGCLAVENKSEDHKYYTEQYRGQYHFSPATAWMNDPNGMVYYKGEYHLFYQYYPKATIWGPMHWGHVVSKDLIHWEQLPIALYPDNTLGDIFSGSVVVDKNNTSGLFDKTGEGLVAIFTHAGRQQQQSIAYSYDNGRTWKKYSGNPVIKNLPDDNIPNDFRDPKVSWNEEFGKWIMVLAVKDHSEIWSSSNLINWQKESEFGKEIGNHDGVWECPDLFSMKNIDNELKWIMLVSINPGGVNGGSATQYFIGNLVKENGKIKYTTTQISTKWIDGGKDNYAGVTWSNTADKRYFIGWMSNWDYAQRVPTKEWRSAMTMTRELFLEKEGTEEILVSRPHSNYETICSSPIFTESVLELNKNYNIGNELSVSRIKISLEKTDSDNYGVEVLNKDGNGIKIGYNAREGYLYVDRTNIGNDGFHWSFSGLHKEYIIQKLDSLNLEMYLDRSSAEVYFNNGKYVITEIMFPWEPLSAIKIYSENNVEVKTKSIDIKKMNSIWN